MPAGRPPNFKTPEALQKAIDAYFKDCDKRDKPYTITGLAYTLGESRRTIYNYEGRPEFLPVIKRARKKVEYSVEERLLSQGQGAAGPIFWLKNNGEQHWKDKTEQEVTGNIGVHEGSDEELLERAKSIAATLGIQLDTE